MKKKCVLGGVVVLTLGLGALAIGAPPESHDLTPLSELREGSELVITADFPLVARNKISDRIAFEHFRFYFHDGRIFDDYKKIQRHKVYDKARKMERRQSAVCEMFVRLSHPSLEGGTLRSELRLAIPNSFDKTERRREFVYDVERPREAPQVYIFPANKRTNQLIVEQIRCEKSYKGEQFTVSDLEAVFRDMLIVYKR